MKLGLSITLATIMLIITVSIIIMSPIHSGVMYNCSIAEISPDIPTAVKEQCRKRSK